MIFNCRLELKESEGITFEINPSLTLYYFAKSRMKNLTIALLTIAAANAVKLEETDYDYSTFSVANIQASYTIDTATVSFDAPSST